MLIKRISQHPEYFIREDGLVWSTKTNRFLTPSIQGRGYHQVTLYPKQALVHRLVAETFFSNLENKPCVNHKDGNKTNNNVSNLEWVTIQENNKHAWNTGLKKSNDRAILSIEQVREIRTKYIPYKYGIPKLAKEYNVSNKCVENILYRNTWK